MKPGEPLRDVRMIFFDLDGTLVFQEPDSSDVIAEFCAEIGQPLSAEAARLGRRIRHQYFIDPAVREALPAMSRAEFWNHYNQHMLAGLGVEGDLQRLADVLSERFTDLDMVYHCPESGCQTLRELRARGYELGLITNRENVDRLQALLDQIEVRPYFSLLVVAGDVKLSKPDPAIFHLALERAGVGPEHALYVGDNYWADVVGAQRAGLRAALLDPYLLFPEADCLILEQIEHLLLWLA